jgi:hypothetical protein
MKPALIVLGVLFVLVLMAAMAKGRHHRAVHDEAAAGPDEAPGDLSV